MLFANKIIYENRVEKCIINSFINSKSIIKLFLTTKYILFIYFLLNKINKYTYHSKYCNYNSESLM